MVIDTISFNNQANRTAVQRNSILAGNNNVKGNSLPQDGKALPADSKIIADANKASDNIELQREELQQITDNLNKYMQSKDLKLQFSLDDESGRTVIKVINKETNEVIRQFPPEEILYLSKSINKALESMLDGNTGLLLEVES